MVDIEVLRTHFRYTAWANARLVEAAARLAPEERTRDFGTSEKSILGTLAHVFAADRIWLSRVQGTARAAFIGPEDLDLAVLERDWPALLDQWQAWLATAGDPARGISYTDLKGNPYTQPLWQILLHVVNHGTHHRGQVSGMIRALGQTPPPLDLIVFYRQNI